MRWWHPILIFLGIVILVGALLWFLDTLSRIYATVAVISPILARGLLWLIIVLLIVGVGIAGYYGWLFLRPRPRRRRPPVPRTPADAAAANLDALQQQVAQLQDEVARQALLDRSRRLTVDLDRQDLHIIVFGVGSAGKTSLINAVLQDPIGATGAAMGTTLTRQTFRLGLRGLDRGILLTDTPGLAEAGVAGTLREQDARRLATEADLLLFVVDNDLQQSDYAILTALFDMGKRLLVVLNKADRYPPAERMALLERMRSRLSPRLSPEDVVAVTAAPQPLPVEGGGWLQPEPDIVPLLERLAAVLRVEGDTLIADNILLQSQRLREEAHQLIEQQRQATADAIVERFQWIGAGVIAVTPLPGIDLLATAAVNAQMVVELGKVYGCTVSLEEGKALALSLAKTLAGLGIVKGSLELLALGLQTNLATVLAGRALQGVSAAYLTRIAGKSFIEYFRHNQDWGDGGIGEVVEEQFRLNQRDRFMQAFLQEAIAKVVPILR